MGNSERDGNTREADLLFEKHLCRSESSSLNGTWNDLFHIGKRVCQGCILSLCLFNVYAGYLMRNTVLDEAQAGIKFARRNNFRYADDTTLMAEREN